MGKYIKKFSTHTQYGTYINSQDKILPNVSLCEQEEELHYNKKPHDYSQDYLTFVALEDGTFTFTPTSSNVISYSTDNGTTWTQGNSVSVNNGDKVLWKGTMTPEDWEGIGTFSSSAYFDVQGNIMSLLFGDNYKEQTDLTGKNYVFYRLFYNNTNIVNAENLSLSATILTINCYYQMFSKCSSLTSAPKLPATTLAGSCYSFMFEYCSSLTTAPELSVTTLEYACYSMMFQNCTALTTAPELPATTLAQQCYSNMFANCTSLTTAPELHATTLTDSCYHGMFQACTGLTNAPELPATTLASQCYSNMFNGCTSLTTAPELPATTLVSGCYYIMFQGCTSLNYIKAMFTTKPSNSYTQNWVSGVSATGTFVKNSAAQWNVSGNNGIPTGWTVQTASN